MKKNRKATPKATREVALPGVVAEEETAALKLAGGYIPQQNPPDTYP